MQTTNLKLVSIICEPVLKATILQLIQTLGASGFTLTEVKGEGSANRHSGEIPELKIKIEVLASETVSKKIVKAISDQFFETYSIILYTTDVNVLRPSKF